MNRKLLLVALGVCVGTAQGRAVLLMRELWDGLPAGNLHRQVATGYTTYGFYPGSMWTFNPAAPSVLTNLFVVDPSSDVQDWQIGLYGYLPASALCSGTLSLLGGNTNDWDSRAWAVRLLATESRINCNRDGVYYFSFRFLKRGLWWNSNGTNGYGYDDAALGLGFANGSSANSRFIGVGVTRSVAQNGGGGYLFDGLDIGDTLYVTAGTLGQAGLAEHPNDSGGPYYVRAYATNAIGYLTGYLDYFPAMDYTWVNGGMVVGRIITRTNGNDELAVRAFVAGETIPGDPDLITWDIVYEFNETVTLSYLLVWMQGQNNWNPCWIDAVRMATTWAEVIGVEIAGPPIITPTNTVYEGTPVTFSVITAVDPTNGYYQWLKDGEYIPDATNAEYSISAAALTDSGEYRVIFQNAYAVAVTSQVATLTVLPAVAPYFVQQPQPQVRYVGAPSVSFTAETDGARPIAYQWYSVSGGTTNLLPGQTNATLVLSNISTQHRGWYFVRASNWVGETNSNLAELGVLVPAAGSYEAAVIGNRPYAYWRLDETTGTIAYDLWGGNHGTVLDPTNVVMGYPGAPFAGFRPGHTAYFIPNNGYRASVNMPPLPVITNWMSICCWLYLPAVPNPDGVIFYRDYGNNGGYGIACGLQFFENAQLGYRWGGGDLNPTEPWNGYRWTDPRLSVPTGAWVFVALVLEGNNATIYLGTNQGPLTVASAELPAVADHAFPGTSYEAQYPLLIGRTGWPWAEGETNSWAKPGVAISDVAVFYQPLTASNVYELYFSALGQQITWTQYAGGLCLQWVQGTLQTSTNVHGPYFDVSGATSPWVVTPGAEPARFYRIRR